jgi:hypothetical protein
MKWHYDKQRKEWYTGESVPYANDDFAIRKLQNKEYKLESHFKPIGYFKKLKTAKLIAYHLLNG